MEFIENFSSAFQGRQDVKGTARPEHEIKFELCLPFPKDRGIFSEKGLIKMNMEKTRKRTDRSLKDLVYVSMFTALIAVCAQICVPTPVPFTLQTLAIFIAGGLLGWKRGGLCLAVYILLGIVGVPVFAEFSGGLRVLFGMTGGYIIGFLFTALIVGFMCEKLGRKLWVLIVSMTLGLAVCYLFGTVWFMVVYTQKVEPIGFVSALGTCVVPYLLFDAAKIGAAAVLVNRLDKIVKF